MDTSRPGFGQSHTITNAHPPEDFVGREAERQTLHRFVFEKQFHFLCIWGEGGIGKTYLARQFACELARTNSFHAVVWTTAKENELAVRESRLKALGGRSQIQVEKSAASRRKSAVRTLDDLLLAIAKHSGYEAPGPQSRETVTREGVLSWLSIRKVLVIIDDVDGWGDNWTQVWEFADALLPPSSILLTSRYRLNTDQVQGISQVQLGPFSQDDSLRLVETLAHRQQFTLPREDERAIADFAVGNPLVMRLSVALARTHPPVGGVRAMLREATRRPTVSLFLYEKLYTGLSSDARVMVSALAAILDQGLPEPSFERLADICRQRPRIAQAAIDELQAAAIIDRDPKDNQKYDMHPLAVDYVISRDPDTYNRLRNQLVHQGT